MARESGQNYIYNIFLEEHENRIFSSRGASKTESFEIKRFCFSCIIIIIAGHEQLIKDLFTYSNPWFRFLFISISRITVVKYPLKHLQLVIICFLFCFFLLLFNINFFLFILLSIFPSFMSHFCSSFFVIKN